MNENKREEEQEREKEVLNANHLLNAYLQGYFPWPSSNEDVPLEEIPWCSPDPRGVLMLKDLKLGRTLKKNFKKIEKEGEWKISLNKRFSEVISNCALVRGNDTWISPSLIKAYEELFSLGFAYSVEVLSKDDELIGGLYGVQIGSYVSGESMFYKKSKASQLALFYLLQMLKEKDIPFLDTQMITPVVASFGGKLISRENFEQMLKEVIS